MRINVYDTEGLIANPTPPELVIEILMTYEAVSPLEYIENRERQYLLKPEDYGSAMLFTDGSGLIELPDGTIMHCSWTHFIDED